MNDLPPGFRVDPELSAQYGSTVAVNDQGQRLRWRPKADGNPTKVYDEAMARGRAKSDLMRLEQGMEGFRNAFALESNATRAESLINSDTPTGPAADFRIDAGKTLGSTLGFLPGIPTRAQAVNLEELRNIQSQGALGDVSQLKGPLSERELAFIQRLQVDPNATQSTNRRVIDAQKWVARRQAGYGAALERWTRELGSPSAVNANGLSFDRWWAQYSSREIPPPWAAQPRRAPPRQGGGGQTAVEGDFSILSVEE